ncbi:hypothetical protein ACQ4PT_038108 [Festuca glaucescens]
MERNSTLCCNDTVLEQCPREYCDKALVDLFFENITGKIWRVDALLLVNAILAGVIVGIGAYGRRYRHYGFTRYLLRGATTLFLPVISYVLSAFGSTGAISTIGIGQLTAMCRSGNHPYLPNCFFLRKNTSPIVATDDREDGTIHPPFELLLKVIWLLLKGVLYLAVTTFAIPLDGDDQGGPLDYLRFTLFTLIPAKMILKCYAFLKARKSFALGCNPPLIVGYMQHLREGTDQQHDQSRMGGEEDVHVPPPLVVMGEDQRQVEKNPNGYMFRKNSEAAQDAGLVTLDRVWQLDNTLLMPMPQLKDLCLSFALFKLLRCRFARYKLTDHVISTKTIKFVKSVLLKDGEHERAFRMIADELSFLHDYYDSPLPISYSDSCLIIISMVISLLSIGYCILCGMDVIYSACRDIQGGYLFTVRQCTYYCRQGLSLSDFEWKPFGSLAFDLVSPLFLFVLTRCSEASDIASHICSSWSKVILTCRCVHRASLQLSPLVPKWVGCLSQCRYSWLITRHWNDKMGQNLFPIGGFFVCRCPG